MAPNAFLTERRREYLNGDYNLENSADRHIKRKIEQGSETALAELIEVAASPEIDNAEVFDPAEVACFLNALMAPEGTVITPRWKFDGDSSEYRDTYQYQLALHGRLDHAIDNYGEMLYQQSAPGETTTFGDVLDLDID
jgi:hypothetical protein